MSGMSGVSGAEAEPLAMPPQAAAYVRWYEEETAGPSGPRTARAAWLVRDVADDSGRRQEVLAYLGQRPAVTAALQEEVAALYPDLDVDWAAIRQALAANPGFTDVAALTDDELALRLRALARERGLSLIDLSLRLGYRQRQVLPELMAFLDDAPTVPRFERTSGSVFQYFADKHPEYAFLIYKARLFFEGDEDQLGATIESEPAGFGAGACRARRRSWQERLDAYRRARRPPLPGRP